MNKTNHSHHFTDYIMRDGLARFAAKMQENGQVTVAFLGGSVTVGSGASDENRSSYRSLTQVYLQKRFPACAFTFVNAAIGGTDSTYGAFRLLDHVFKQGSVDLLFVEYAINDAGDRERSIRGMEGIVRYSKRLNPDIDICFLYTASFNGAEAYGKSYRLQDNIYNHEEVANHYRISSVCFAVDVYRQIASGQMQWEEFSYDEGHPHDAGYAMYHAFLKHFLENAIQADRPLSNNIIVMPIPLDAHCYDSGVVLPPSFCLETESWQTIQDWSHELTCNWQPPATVFYSDEPGSSFTYEFEGTAVGVALLAGMDTGELDFYIDGSPYQTTELFDSYCPQFYRPKAVVLADGLTAGSHLLVVRISENKHPDSKGHAIHLMSVMIS